MGKKNEISVIVTLKDSSLGKFEEVREVLIHEGLQLKKSMPKLGVISGTTSNIESLKRVKGVQNVEVEMHATPS